MSDGCGDEAVKVGKGLDKIVTLIMTSASYTQSLI